ncbi:MAG: argininosuccinate synthase domain-containing protein, partial [Candidatus Gracilibacteria bacterium]
AKKSVDFGASKHIEIDAQKELYDKFASYLIKANYLKGGVYPACVGPERNVIAMEMAKMAKKENTTVIGHGSTGAGNDQVRFDVALRALIPNVTILAPIRDENITRDEEVEFLHKRGFSIEPSTNKYSINIGLLGTTIGGAETLNTEKELPSEAFPTVKSLDECERDEAIVKIGFKRGLPEFLNGEKKSGPRMITELNEIASAHGFGRDYHIGTTIIGIKGRVGFEAPALKIIIKAHMELEKIILTSKQIFWKNTLGTVYGDMTHEGLYFDPLLRDIEAFLDSSSKFTDGNVEVRIQQGNISITSLTSPYSLMQSAKGIYGEKTGAWDGVDAKGFCKLYGMESVNAFLLQNKDNINEN